MIGLAPKAAEDDSIRFSGANTVALGVFDDLFCTFDYRGATSCSVSTHSTVDEILFDTPSYPIAICIGFYLFRSSTCRDHSAEG
jgi:hypothetical protein